MKKFKLFTFVFLCLICFQNKTHGAENLSLEIGIFNRKIASIESFTYSKILENMDNEWDALNLDGFLTDPKKKSVSG